jgi:ubiquinone biosynthesis O-methyltransferase
MSYTLKMFEQRQLQQALDSRRLGGYFSRVISVHPLAGVFEAGDDRFGRPIVTRIDDAQIFVEGRLGRTRWLKAVGPVNFLLAQVDLLNQLIRMSREAGISVVRVGDPYYLGIMGWLLAKRLDRPLAIRVPFRYDEIRRITGRATMPRLFRFGWVEKAIERFIFPRCDLIAGANEDNMRYAIENGGRAEVATVFRYGNLLHSCHWVEPRNRPSADADLEELGLRGTVFVATVARLEPMKRVEDTIRIVAELVRRGCDIHALIIGDGSLRAALEEDSRARGLQRRIVFAGERKQEWIARVLPHAAAILSPHMGRALVEAALGAVPIVAFDYDWQREVVSDDETGYLVANGDWMRMADCTQSLLSDPARARAMGANARAKVSIMMDPARLMHHEQATYSSLLERWEAARAVGTSAPQKVSTPASSSIALFFDEMAVKRNEVFRAHPVLAYEQEVRSAAVLDLLGAKDGETILDIGCGNARDVLPLAQAGSRVVGVDLSEGMIEQARTDLVAAGIREVELQVGDVTALQFPAQCFDKILCSEVIEHVPDPDLAIQEMFRVLKPGGSLVISTPNRSSWYGFDRYVLWNRVLMRKWNHPFDHWRTMRELSSLLERHRFRIVSGATVCYVPGFIFTYRLPRFLQSAVVRGVGKARRLASWVAPRFGYLLVVKAVRP